MFYLRNPQQIVNVRRSYVMFVYYITPSNGNVNVKLQRMHFACKIRANCYVQRTSTSRPTHARAAEREFADGGRCSLERKTSAHGDIICFDSD